MNPQRMFMSWAASAWIAGVTLMPPPQAAQAGECEPAWVSTFGGMPGMSHRVNASVVFDDGSGNGPALYVGGEFTSATGIHADYVTKWDGTTWSGVGGGVSGDDSPGVTAMTVHDDGLGGGPALYVADTFTHAGGVPASCIAKWDGTSWSAVGSGIQGDITPPLVSALAVFDDRSGAGPALYASGSFSVAGGVPANRIAKWDGVSWSDLGSGTTDYPLWAMAVFDDGLGGGPALYVGGYFTDISGVPANSLAKWDGTSWSAVGGGLVKGGGFPSIRAVTVFDDGLGGGPALYVGGDFFIPSVSANRIARWDGTSWSALGSGTSGPIFSLTAFDDGSGDGPALYAGGDFSTAGGIPAHRIAKWNGASWSAFGSVGMNGQVSALTVFDDGSGSGPALYAGGEFTSTGSVVANRVAKWDGVGWSALGGGLFGTVLALTTFDDGSGSGLAIYAGGRFQTAGGGMNVHQIAKWNGTSWLALGSGVGGLFVPEVPALAVFDDGLGGGPALYAGGTFFTAGGITVNHIAR